MTVLADTPKLTVEKHPEWLTQEKYDGLVAKTIPMDSLSQAQQDEFLAFVSNPKNDKVPAPEAPAAPAAPAAGATPEKPAAAPAAAPAPSTPPAPTAAAPSDVAKPLASPSEVPLASPEDRQKFFEKHNRLAAQANTVTQLSKNLRKWKQDLEAKIDSITKRPVTQADADDPLAVNSVKRRDEELSNLRDTVAALQDMLQKQSGALEAFHNEAASTLQAETSLLGLERFQFETQTSDLLPQELSLQTTVPLSMLNAELDAFAKKVGGMEQVNKYLTDAAFKAQVEAQGNRLSEGFIKNLDTFNLIHDLNEEVRSGKATDHMQAYLGYLYKEGKLAAALRNAKLAGAAGVAQGIASQHTATPTLEPSKDAAPKAVGWTVTSARDWIAKHPEIKPGSADDQTFQEIMTLMNAGQLR